MPERPSDFERRYKQNMPPRARKRANETTRRPESPGVNPNRTRRREYDGVVYEPSSGGGRTSSSGGRPASGSDRRASSGNRPPAARKNTKPRLAVFYIVTLLAGVVVCLTLFAMAFKAMTGNNPVIEGTIKPTVTPPPGIEDKTFMSVLGMVTAAETGTDRSLTLLDLNTGRSATYTVTDTTELKNRFGTAITFSEVKAGMIAEAGYNTDTLAIVTFNESAQAWEHKNKSNIKVDTEKSALVIGNEIYSFNSQLLTLYRGKPYPIGHVMPIDTVSVTGYGDQAWCVILETNHGFLWIEHADKVVNGTLAVDTSIFMGLDDLTEPIALAEGTHRVIIEGQNIEPFITDVTVTAGETANASLMDVELKTARLIVNVNEMYSDIIIDGELQTEAGPAEVSFGEHTVRVEKDGFVPVQQNITVTKALTEITVTLEAITRSARLTIDTVPSQADIYIDNAYAGTSPLTQEVTLGSHNIIAKKSGYTDKSIQVTAEEGDNACYIILTESNEPLTDPFGNLPVPSDEPIQDDTGIGTDTDNGLN